MEVIQVGSDNKDFIEFCSLLEKFQYNLIPSLANSGYTLKADKDITPFLLIDGNKPIGSIGIKRINDESCEIVRVYVNDESRGKGFARMLFSHVENYAREHGYQRAEMVTWAASTSALRLYEKLGYTRSDEKTSEWFKGLKYFELYKALPRMRY